MRHFSSSTLFDGDLIAGFKRQIQRRNRRRDIERDIVFFGQNSQAVGTDFVCDVAIGGDPVGSDNNASNAAASQEVPGHIVGDQSCFDAITLQLPRREPGALQEGTRFVSKDINLLACLYGGANYTERSAESGRGKCASIAVS